MGIKELDFLNEEVEENEVEKDVETEDVDENDEVQKEGRNPLNEFIVGASLAAAITGGVHAYQTPGTITPKPEETMVQALVDEYSNNSSDNVYNDGQNIYIVESEQNAADLSDNLYPEKVEETLEVVNEDESEFEKILDGIVTGTQIFSELAEGDSEPGKEDDESIDFGNEVVASGPGPDPMRFDEPIVYETDDATYTVSLDDSGPSLDIDTSDVSTDFEE